MPRDNSALTSILYVLSGIDSSAHHKHEYYLDPADNYEKS